MTCGFRRPEARFHSLLEKRIYLPCAANGVCWHPCSSREILPFTRWDRRGQWNGKRYIGTEHFFVARYADEQASLARTGLLPDEQVNLDTYVWMSGRT